MRFPLVFLSLYFSASLNAQNIVSGYIRDSSSKETLIGVSLWDLDTKNGTSTNAYGYFSFSTSKDSLMLSISYVGYQTINLPIEFPINVLLDITLEPITTTLKDIVVYADSYQIQEEVTNTDLGVFNLKPKEAYLLPSIGGEADILKVLQLMPGISRGGEATTSLYVRGGTDDQNLVTLDEAVVYNVGHLFGFFSVFNSDAINNVNVIKGGFESNYGGRLSSVIDTRMDNGNSQNWEAKGGVGLLTSRITIDGPLKKDKASIMLAARRTYIDKVLSLFKIPLPYYFYDLNTKINIEVNNNNRVFLSGYFGRDVLAFDENAETEEGLNEDLTFGFNLGNFTTTLRWNHIYRQRKLFSTITLFQTRFNYDIGGQFVDNSLLIRSQIQDYGIKADWEYQTNAAVFWKMGWHATAHLFRPNIVNTSGEITEFLKSKKGAIIQTLENAWYGGFTFDPHPKIKAYVGTRISTSTAQNKVYAGVEPRVNITYLFFPNTSLKLSYSLMRQYMHRVSSSSIALPTDLWYPVTRNVLPQVAHHMSAGFFQALNHWRANFSAEVYYKKMNHLIEYREGARLLLNNNFEEELVSGNGTSYGLEVLLRKQTGPFTGWIGYTWSKSDRQFEALNQGHRYPARYDRRHDLSIVTILRITGRVDLAWTWIYATGASFTPQTGQYIVPNPSLTGVELIPIYAPRNSVKLSPSHRMDLNITVRPKKVRKMTGEWQFSIYNFYNQATPSRISISSNGQSLYYSQPGLFGLIPSFSYNFKL